MPEFTYTARDNAGEKVSGSIAAENRREALATLSAKALFPIEVDTTSKVVEDARVRRVPGQLLAVAYGQLSDLLRSGVPLLRALEVLQNQTSHAALKHTLHQVHRHVKDGATLAEAMSRFRRVFGDMAVSMVRAGGEGAFLEEALARVAAFTETQDDLRKRTLGAVAYPAVLAVVGTVVVTVLIVFFVPKFDELFARLRDRGELPALTEWLLWTSRQLGGWLGLLILAVVVLGGWSLAWRLRTDSGRLWFDRIKIRLPLAGKIFLNLAVARFCRVLGTLLRNGVPILRSLEIAREATGNRVLGAAVADATENITAGQTLAEPLAASGRFPPTVVEMIAVGEQSNNLEEVLPNIADSLERQTWRRLDLAVRLLEPALLVILAGVVLVVVLALLLPVFRLMSAF